jgi:hypothetical protein
MKSFNCELSLTIARTCVPYMLQVVPHLIKVCGYPFSRRSLIVDHAPLSANYAHLPNLADLSQLRDCCDKLLETSVIDKVIDIDYSYTRRAQIYNKHFGRDVRQTHDWRGTPIYSYIFSIEEAQADYLLHFDSDMLLYQQEGFNWIERGIELLQEHSDVMVVNPLAGPPSSDGVLYQIEPYQHDSRGFYRFKAFSARVFLLDRKRFDSLLPLHPQSRTDGKLIFWEQMVTARIRETPFVRVDLDSPQAWSLHPNDHSADFITALPKIIERVEEGWYPPEQSGYYDLRLGAWMRHLGIDRKCAKVHSVKQALESYIEALRRHQSPRVLNGIRFNLHISGAEGGHWVVDLSNLVNPISVGDRPTPCTISVSANDLIDIFNGELNTDLATALRLLQIEGDGRIFKYFISP